MKALYFLLSLSLSLQSAIHAQTDTCIDFEDFAVGMGFSNGMSFAEDGVLMTIGDYVNGDGLVTSGTATIIGSSRYAGNSLSLSNATVELEFDCIKELSLVFGNNGGNINISINGQRVFIKTLQSAYSIGGVDVTVSSSGSTGTMSFVAGTASIQSLCVGGQEFLVDHICFLPCENPDCFDFEGLTNSPLDVGDGFTEDGIDVDVVSFGDNQGTIFGGEL